MDIVAHALWTGTGMIWLGRLRPVSTHTLVLTVTLGVLPDLIHLLPLLAWWISGGGSFEALKLYALATPATEPSLPPLVHLLSHHLHCTFHSAIVSAAVGLLIGFFSRSFWLPLLGWYGHVLIDVFTHSNDFYPSPVFYPVTMSGFDGIAWNAPWFIALNYLALAITATALLIRRRG